MFQIQLCQVTWPLPLALTTAQSRSQLLPEGARAPAETLLLSEGGVQLQVGGRGSRGQHLLPGGQSCLCPQVGGVWVPERVKGGVASAKSHDLAGGARRIGVLPNPDEARQVGHHGQREAAVSSGETLRADWTVRSPKRQLQVQRDRRIRPATQTLINTPDWSP